MSHLVYQFLTLLSGLFGTWLFKTVSWFIATGFFLFFPGRVAVSARFYRVLFPSRRWPYHRWCAWRQYHNFTDVFLDRFLLRNPGNITCTSEGLEHLLAASGNRTGGIILMSHMGNWEVAARLLQGKGIRLLLYMGIKDKERIERLQKKDLAESGVTIVAVEKEKESPLEILEGINFIKNGGFVSITGDRLWRKDQRALEVRFLNRTALLPEAPHLLSLLSKAPVFIFFIFKTGKRSYHIHCTEPIPITAASRKERKEAITVSAQTYASRLEKMVRLHPLEWYHFEKFIKD